MFVIMSCQTECFGWPHASCHPSPQDGNILEYASEELRERHDIVMAAVSQKGMALEFASAECGTECANITSGL